MGYCVEETDEETEWFDTYPHAVAWLNERCDTMEAEGMDVERGWASSGNYAAAKCSAPNGTREVWIAIELDESNEDADES